MAQIIPLYKTSDAKWVDIEDDATPYLRYLASTFPSEMKTALKSLGWFLRGKIVEGLQSGAPGGRALAPLSPIQGVRLIDAIKKSKKRKRPLKYAKGRLGQYTPAHVIAGATSKPFGRKMAKAVRYFYDDPSRSVHIGWVTPTAASYGRAGVGGMRGSKHKWWRGPQTVTARMRKLFAAAGIFLREGQTLKTPERPAIDFVLDRHQAEIPKYLESKVSQWLDRSFKRSVRYHSAKLAMGNTPAFRRFVRYAA